MQTGTLLSNRYRIEAKLGEGGMGVVFRAHDTLLQRPVAIKTLAPALFGDEGARRILREAQSVARLNHPQIVSIFDALEETGSFAIVMEYVEGKTLRELIPVQINQLIGISTQVVQALEYAHAQGIVHRDIKPENIIVTVDGVAKLMDFGLARSEGRSRLTQTGMVVGTVAYLAPEQALGGQVDGRSDLYSLGAVLYEAATGHPPFESDDPISVITQHINVPPVAPHWHNPSIPPPLENVILKLLAKDPARRYQSAKELLAALTSIRTGSTAVTGEPEKLAGPGLVERIARSPLVGRDPELTTLKELVDRTIAGGGGVVLLTGSLGVGKTRLIEEAATFARLRGATVVSGKAYESAPPFEPFARALRDLARGVDSDTLAVRLGESAPEVVGLIPELSRQLPRVEERTVGSPEDRKNRLFAGVAHFIASTATHNPVLLILDDMHLADVATTELLQHVARRTEVSRILLIVAYRSEDVPATPAGKLFGQVAHALSREGFCTAIGLRSLTEEQVVDLIKLMANLPNRPVRFGRRIFEGTEGNPYFIEEVIKGLFERGTLYIKDGQWSTDFDEARDYSLLEIPSSVHSAVEARLRTLDDQTRQILTQASVVGRQFDFDTLLAVTDVDEAELLNRVEEAIRVQLIREVRGAGEDVYEFAQPMLRQVLHDSIPRRRRRLLHRQVGEAVERLHSRKLEPHLDALAFHFTEGEESEKSLRYARLAARKAAGVFAHDDAASYLRQAITAAEEVERPQDRLELLEELGDLLSTAGHREQTVRAYEDAVQLWKSLAGTSVSDGARLYRKLGELGTRWAVYNPRTREHINAGLKLLENSPTHPERVKLIIAKAFDHYWLRPEAECDYQTAEASAREGYRLGEEIGSLQDMSAALDALSGMYQQLADFRAMAEATERRVPIVERLDDAPERFDLHTMLGRSEEFLGRFAEALQHYLVGYDLASRGGAIARQRYALSDAVRVCMKRNQPDEADRWSDRYEELERRTGTTSPTKWWIVLARGLTAGMRGDRELTRAYLAEALQLTIGHPSLAWYRPLVRLQIALAAGDHALAGAQVEEALSLADTPWAKLEVQAVVLQFAGQTQAWDYVNRLGDDTLARARRSGGPHYVALTCLALGIHRREHHDLDGAEALLKESVELFRTMDCPYDLARTLRELALLHRAQGRASDAVPLLQEALTHFESIGARPDVERTRALM